MDYGDRPAWAERIAREREAREWLQSQAVANLRMVYAQRHSGKEGGSADNLLGQWKDWESGRVCPKHWAPFIATIFGTVEDDLFPAENNANARLIAVAGMDSAELVARLSRPTIDEATLHALPITAERLCTEYRYRPARELRAEGQQWLRRIARLLDQRLTYQQHGEVFALGGLLALLVGCVEYDAGDQLAAESTRQFALDLVLKSTTGTSWAGHTRCQPGSRLRRATTSG